MAEVIANFSAGPSALPRPVRQAIAEKLLPDQDASPSIIEVSHRGPVFGQVAEELKARLASLTGTQHTHEILLLQGGANLQFAQMPLNFASQCPPGFLITGHWGEKALAEARRIGQATVVASTQAQHYQCLPPPVSASEAMAYVHYTGNETIHGVQFASPPSVVDHEGDALPLVADLSSEFLSRPYPYQDLAGFYAGAQKNLGVAGVTIVGLAKDWLAQCADQPRPAMAKYLDYFAWIDSDSMLNTPVTFAWFVALEMLRWIDAQGGLEVLEQRNQDKACKLYDCIDASDFYLNAVEGPARSVMNVPFWIEDRPLEPVFVAEAEQAGLLGLKGHRAVGGLRASLYNAIEPSAVDALVDFMNEFERRHG